MAASALVRPTITDDTGDGLSGTIFNAAFFADIFDRIDALFSATTGLTLNQGAGDAAILTLESSDVAHGMTTIIGTSVYANLAKFAANDGGLRLRALTEAAQALYFHGSVTTEDSSRSTTAIAAVMVNCETKSGTSVAAMTANMNMFAISNGGTTKFIFDSDGDSHEDGTGWTAYDDYDDVKLIASVEGLLSKDPLRAEFQRWMTYNRAALQKARLVSFNRDGHHFVNRSRLQMALCGAIRQQASALAKTQRQVARLQKRITAA
jgi:hypothetical protein